MVQSMIQSNTEARFLTKLSLVTQTAIRLSPISHPGLRPSSILVLGHTSYCLYARFILPRSYILTVRCLTAREAIEGLFGSTIHMPVQPTESAATRIGSACTSRYGVTKELPKRIAEAIEKAKIKAAKENATPPNADNFTGLECNELLLERVQ